MDVQGLSQQYNVRALSAADVDQIYRLSVGNELFYRFHPPFVTKESILEDMNALPPGKGMEDKAYIGFFEHHDLIAVMDLIFDYPEKGVVFIGLFMMDAGRQGRGTGSGIIGECVEFLRREGYKKLRLAVDKGNPQSDAFWRKNHFVRTGEEYPNESSAYMPMERIL